ncbi:MAG: hypothetical protein PHG00_11150 [Methylococcales bacterium]|nr:hypothetical protein [Methylococcales bacterium]
MDNFKSLCACALTHHFKLDIYALPSNLKSKLYCHQSDKFQKSRKAGKDEAIRKLPYRMKPMIGMRLLAVNYDLLIGSNATEPDRRG